MTSPHGLEDQGNPLPPADTHRNDAAAGEFDRDLSAPEPFKGLRILDIGCGTGRHSIELAKRGHAVTGLDLPELRRWVPRLRFSRVSAAPLGDGRSRGSSQASRSRWGYHD